MKQFTLSVIMALLLLLASACRKDEAVEQFSLNNRLTQLVQAASPTGQMDYFRMPPSTALAQIPQDPNNPLSAEKIELGKILFHETGLAKAAVIEAGQDTYSCASCHFAGAGFQAGRWQGLGEGGSGFGINGEGRSAMLSLYEGNQIDAQPIRSPSAMNGAWQEVMLWNGQFGATGPNQGTEAAWKEGTPIATNKLGYHGLETQAIAGLTVHRMEIDQMILEDIGCRELYDLAFPDIPTDRRYNLETAGLAIAAYERILLSNQAPFQKWLKGDRAALSEAAIRGAIIFFDPKVGNCVSCHTGPALNSMEFYALGMNDLHQLSEEVFHTSDTGPELFGRGGFTGKVVDYYTFKVPQLYNLADSPFYGHGSSFRSIREVLEYKNEAVPENINVPEQHLAAAFQPLHLSSAELADLTIFLEEGLYDPELHRYEPAALPSGNCFPFGDEIARRDLGCE